MKGRLAGLLVGLMVLTIGATSAFASEPSTPTNAGGTGGSSPISTVVASRSQATPTATSAEAMTAMTTSMIESATKGDTVKVATADKATVSKDVFTAAKTKGVSLTIESEDGGISFAFQDLNSIDKMTSAFTAKGTIGDAIEEVDKKIAASASKGVTAVDVDFTFSGTLPGTAKVTLAIPDNKFTEGATVYFYYYDATAGMFEKIDSATVKNGEITVTMTHCSEYVIVDKELDSSIVKAATSAATGDNTPIVGLLVALLAGLSACGYAYFKKVRA